MPLLFRTVFPSSRAPRVILAQLSIKVSYESLGLVAYPLIFIILLLYVRVFDGLAIYSRSYEHLETTVMVEGARVAWPLIATVVNW